MDWGEIIRVGLEVGVAVFGLSQRRKAQQEKRTADDLRRIIDEAHRLGREQPDLSSQARQLRPPKTPAPKPKA